MKFVFFLALKNLLRYKRRTIITTIAIAMGIAVFVIMDGFIMGMERDSERNLVWYETGSAKVMQEEFWQDYDYLPLKKSIADHEQIIQRINDLGFTATPRISFHGEIFHGYDSMQIIVHGIDTQTDEDVYKLRQTLLTDSQYLQKDEPGIIIGQWLARDLKVEVGDWVDIRTRTRNGVNDVWELPIVGIINTPNPTLNKGTAFMPLSYAGEKLAMQGDITELVVGFAEWQNPDINIKKIKSAVTKEFPGLVVLSWQQVADDYLAMRDAERAENVIILFLIFVIAAVGISNTMLMAVYERIKEIGMMRALGMREALIRLTFLFEAGGIGLLGSLVGLLLGAFGNYFFVTYGFDFSAFIGEMDWGYRISGVLRSVWNPPGMLFAVVFGVIISMLISFIPSRKALKMNITDSLRYK